jgi:tRNA G18 (ribose-2'-O)-methylase SpoU
VLAIRQFGSTRSINAAAASAVAMHEWIRRHAGGTSTAAG